MAIALKKLKSGKAPGPDGLHPEFIIFHRSVTDWLRLFLSSCLSSQTMPKEWRRATVISILKPNKPANNPKSYRPISLLCVTFKLMERLINRIKHIIDEFIPHEQAGFREGRLPMQQEMLSCPD